MIPYGYTQSRCLWPSGWKAFERVWDGWGKLPPERVGSSNSVLSRYPITVDPLQPSSFLLALHWLGLLEFFWTFVFQAYSFFTMDGLEAS
jgi:hypothetical protein